MAASFVEPRKSANDKRLYRIFKLENEMKVWCFNVLSLICPRQVLPHEHHSSSTRRLLVPDPSVNILCCPMCIIWKVCCVSDPDTDKSSAAVNVNVGSLADPDEFPGLAHFCEHMLFLGTEKFPLENGMCAFAVVDVHC